MKFDFDANEYHLQWDGVEKSILLRSDKKSSLSKDVSQQTTSEVEKVVATIVQQKLSKEEKESVTEFIDAFQEKVKATIWKKHSGIFGSIIGSLVIAWQSVFGKLRRLSKAKAELQAAAIEETSTKKIELLSDRIRLKRKELMRIERQEREGKISPDECYHELCRSLKSLPLEAFKDPVLQRMRGRFFSIFTQVRDDAMKKMGEATAATIDPKIALEANSEMKDRFSEARKTLVKINEKLDRKELLSKEELHEYFYFLKIAASEPFDRATQDIALFAWLPHALAQCSDLAYLQELLRADFYETATQMSTSFKPRSLLLCEALKKTVADNPAGGKEPFSTLQRVMKEFDAMYGTAKQYHHSELHLLKTLLFREQHIQKAQNCFYRSVETGGLPLSKGKVIVTTKHLEKEKRKIRLSV
ncbi:MAG TPA: hypothetical protein VN457_06360, partial [Chlamydiales bacterium]|nr:hypothetical protein [Chlamydiales bacterium]